jgi:hypothetical protein
MITNTGKNIIAKYLIGEAPAYASFMALGCGAEPRNTVNSLVDVDTFEYAGGTIVLPPTPNPTSLPITITGIVSTVGLLPGMTIAGVGAGSFGSGVATITAVVNATSITITTATASTAGAITFYVFGSYSLIKIDNKFSLWKGARLSQVSSQGGSLDQSAITTVDKIFNEVTGTGARPALARITPGPVSGKIDNALLSIQIDPTIKSLEFESIRVPITSRGYVNDSGTNKVILTAQLPSEERYEFTEIGIYSAGSNRTAGVFDSKTISPFSATEGWQLNANGTVLNPSTTNSVNNSFKEYDVSIIDSNNIITAQEPAIKIRTSNAIFANQSRISRYEKTRFLDNVFLVKGNNSFIYKQGVDQVILDSLPSKEPKFLQLSNKTIDLSKNSSSDLIKLAFSIVSVNGNEVSQLPLDTFIIVEFLNGALTESAKMEIQISRDEYDLARNRYIVVTKKLEDLVYTSQFSWKNANTIRVYASTTRDVVVTKKIAPPLPGNLPSGFVTLTTSSEHGLNVGDRVFVSGVAGGTQDLDGIKTITAVTKVSPHTITYASAEIISSEANVTNGKLKATDDRFYIALDALRLDNVNTVNPIYGLVGYSIIQNETKAPVVKSPNTQNFVEYRFVLDVT